MENTVRLGSLGLMEYFKLPGEEIVYRTITYAPSNTCPTAGTRWCLNMTTLQAQFIFCRMKVELAQGDKLFEQLE